MIPSGRTKGKGCIQRQVMSQQGDEGKQAQQSRTGAQNGVGRPLTLSFKAQMGANFFKGDFNPPATNNPGENLGGVGGLVSSKESGRGELAKGVAHQHPTDREWV